MHPAAEIVQQAEALRAQGRGAEADRALEMAFSMAFMEAGGLPCAARIAPEEGTPVPLASPAHALVQICRRSLLVHFRQGIELTPAISLHVVAPLARMFSHIASRLPDDGLREIVVNVSDGCETEGEYRRLSPSCSRPDTILIPDHHFANSEGYADLRRQAETAPAWRARRDVVLWRGASNGRPLGAANFYQRLELCRCARDSAFADRLDIGMTDLAGIFDDGQRAGAEGLVRPFVPNADFPLYRYLIDIDGWSNSWALLEKLIMGATVLKVDSAFGYRQWFYDRLVPWRHYVPLSADLADFDEKLAWLFAVPEEAEKIAAAGRALAADIRFAPEMAEAERTVAAALRPAS
jgi:hypothetical protein